MEDVDGLAVARRVVRPADLILDLRHRIGSNPSARKYFYRTRRIASTGADGVAMSPGIMGMPGHPRR